MTTRKESAKSQKARYELRHTKLVKAVSALAVVDHGEYQRIVAHEEVPPYSKMVQCYTDQYYLRVEDATGAGILKVWFSPSGQILPAYELLPYDDLDYEFVEWARGEIASHQVKK
jgi:hypothetical protein